MSSNPTITVTPPVLVVVTVSMVGIQGPSGSVAGALLADNNLSDVPFPATALSTIGGLATGGDGSGLSGVASSAQGTLADSALQGADIGATVQAWSTVLDNTTASYTTDEETKLGYVTVSQAVDLDQMETDIAALASGMVYKGDWDASSGSFPSSGSAQTGWFYFVSVTGTVDGVEFTVGDNIVALTDGASTSTFAGNWSKHDQTDAVQAVVGLTGSISKSSLLTALNVQDGATITNATTVEAAGALMDSELASIADVKALDQSLVSGATPTFDIENMTIDDSALVVADTTNLQSYVDKTDAALLKARGTGFTTTYDSSATIGGTTFSQPAVTGEIASDLGYFSIDYAGETDITVATGAASVYVYIDSASNLQQQTTIPTRQDWSRKMFTMRISVNTVTGNILGFEYLANPIGHYSNSIRDLYEFVKAAGLALRKGQDVTGRTDGLGFDAGAGSSMEYGGTGDIHNPNIKNFDAVSNAEYDLLERVDIAAQNLTDLVIYWDNAGTITLLGSTTLAGHRLYRFSNGQFAMQYGQGNYANMALARAGAPLEDYVLNPRLLNATFLGWWFIESTATVTSGTPTLTFFQKYRIGID
jgi:hypothetical protein